MRKIFVFLTFCFVYSTAESQTIMGGKYRKLFYLPQADCRQACQLETQIEGLTVIVMGKKDGDDFDVRVCEEGRLVMYQRFFMTGIKSDENFKTWFKGTMTLKKFLEFYFGIKWKRGKPYIDPGFIPTESTALCGLFISQNVKSVLRCANDSRFLHLRPKRGSGTIEKQPEIPKTHFIERFGKTVWIRRNP